MGSFSRPLPFLRFNYTVDTCCVVSADKTSFLPCILHLRPSLEGYVTIKTHRYWRCKHNISLKHSGWGNLLGEISRKINHTLSPAYNDTERKQQKKKNIKQMNIM